jgi:Spx/MgsR family transcriptional regulator
MALTLFGMPNCDTVKKARAWLDAAEQPYTFHDFKKAGVPDALNDWVRAVGWATLLNRQGTTWRKLDANLQASVVDDASALAVMRAQPSVIKRPVLVRDGQVLAVGFKPEQYAALFSG